MKSQTMSSSESNSGIKRSQCSLDKFFTQTECVKKKRTEEEEGGNNSAMLDDVDKNPVWSKINQNNINISYAVIFHKDAAKRIFKNLELEIKYFSGALAQVHRYSYQCDYPVFFCFR